MAIDLEAFVPFLKGFNATTIAYIVFGCAILVCLVFLVKWIKDKRNYDILVEITPMWAVKEETIMKSKEPTLFQKKIGIKPQPQQITEQKHTSYFVSGAYVFNKNNGTYEIRLKDREKSVVAGVPYEYFIPITFGKYYRRYLKLFRYGPADYKPCKISYEGIDEIRHLYDSESTYIALKTQEEIRERYLKGNKWEKWMPYIFMIVMVGALIIYGVIQQKGLEKVAGAIGQHASQIGEYTKALMTTVK